MRDKIEEIGIIVLPIIKKYSDLIFSGVKKYEYRKHIPKKSIHKILVYESRGSGKIIGELNVGKIIRSSIDELWFQTSEDGGIDKEAYLSYFKSCDKGYAISIESFKRYVSPIDKSEFGIKGNLQNFKYVIG